MQHQSSLKSVILLITGSPASDTMVRISGVFLGYVLLCWQKKRLMRTQHSFLTLWVAPSGSVQNIDTAFTSNTMGRISEVFPGQLAALLTIKRFTWTRHLLLTCLAGSPDFIPGLIDSEYFMPSQLWRSCEHFIKSQVKVSHSLFMSHVTLCWMRIGNKWSWMGCLFSCQQSRISSECKHKQ